MLKPLMQRPFINSMIGMDINSLETGVPGSSTDTLEAVNAIDAIKKKNIGSDELKARNRTKATKATLV